MAKFQFIGGYPTVYPEIIIPGVGSLSVNPGDIVDLDSAPNGGQWIAIPDPQPAAPAASAPAVKASPVPATSPAKVTDVNA